MTPLRGPRDLVRIPQITTMRDDDGDDVPEKVAILCEMKRGIREFFNLERVPTDDPILYGTLPNGKEYRKRLGGFRHGSYTITFAGDVDFNEYFFTDTGWTSSTRAMKSITFGLPHGHNTIQVIAFIEDQLGSAPIADSLNKLITPEGNSYDLFFTSDDEVPETGVTAP